MARYVAFLRGMNLGGRRIKNDELCAQFEALGFGDVAAFQASGNIVFDTRMRSVARIAERLEDGLERSLGYSVPTFLRTATEVVAIARRDLFDEALGKSGAKVGKVQVALLPKKPSAAARKKVLDLATTDDRLEFYGSELYWLPSGSILDTELDVGLIEKTVGTFTIRTKGTMERLAAKYFEGV